MKKIVTLLAFIFAINSAFAQCVPSAKTIPGAKSYLIPDSATGLKHACPGKPYDETIYIKAFKDTTVLIFVFTTDSFIVNLDPAVIGLPSYLTLSTVPAALPPNTKHNFPHLSIPGEGLACVKITGNVTGTPSSTPLSIQGKVYGKLNIFGSNIDTNQLFTYNSYKLVVDPIGTGACWATGIENVNNYIAQIIATPNPVNNLLQLEVAATQAQKVTAVITNTMGQVVATKIANLTTGSNYLMFNTEGLANGTYIYTIRGNRQTTKSGRFSKQ